jgi:hypothetical protein
MPSIKIEGLGISVVITFSLLGDCEARNGTPINARSTVSLIVAHAAYSIGCCSQEDQPRAESAMGKEEFEHPNRYGEA